jgi:hypothetical protein
MLIRCIAKGCNQLTEAKLNEKTDEVICMECGAVIPNVTIAAKRALKDMRQIVRENVKKAFQQFCPTCGDMRDLVLKEGRACCSVCSIEIKVTPAFLQALKVIKEKEQKQEEIDKKKVVKKPTKKEVKKDANKQ